MSVTDLITYDYRLETMFAIRKTIDRPLVEPVYNHVHHANSLRLLEEGRLALLESIGFPNEQLISEGLFLVIAALEVRYRRELLLEDEVKITCENARVDGKSLFVTQRILKARDRAAVEALVELKCMSGETKRAVLPPEEFVNAFRQTGQEGAGTS